MAEDIPMLMERKNGEPDFVAKLKVGFGLLQIEDRKQSKLAGRPIFVDVEHIQIMVPLDPKSLILRPATAKDRLDYPTAYAAFKSQEVLAKQGTPIEHWTILTRAEAATLKAAGLKSVEELAEVQDEQLKMFGNQAKDWRAKARAFIAQASNSAAVLELAAEKEDLKRQLAEQSEQLKQLAAQMLRMQQHQDQQLPASPVSGDVTVRRGRKPASEAAA